MQRKESRPTMPAAACEDEIAASGFTQALSASSERSARLVNLALALRLDRDEDVRRWITSVLSPEELDALERNGYRR